MSDIIVDFTISQINADLSVDPAPNVTLNVQDPMTANFYIEGTTGNVAPGGLPGSIQYNIANSTFGGSGTFMYQTTANINAGIDISNAMNVGNVYVGDISGLEVITIKSPTTGSPNTLYLYGSLRENKSGGSLFISAGDGQGTGANGDGGSLTLYSGTAGSGGNIGEVFIGNPTGSNVLLYTGSTTWKYANTGALQINGSAGSAGDVLTSQGSSTSPSWQTLGNISQINLNGNGSEVLAGNGSWIVQSGGSNLNNVINAYEAVTITNHASGTYQFDILTSSIVYSTATATGNITLDFRGNSTTSLSSQVSVGKSVTAVYIMRTSNPAYIPTTINIDGTFRNVLYAGGITPVPIVNITCSYTYTMIKLSDSPLNWLVLGSQTRYG